MGPWGVGLQGECMNEKAKTAAAQRSNVTRLTWRESGTQACKAIDLGLRGRREMRMVSF